MIWVWVMVKNQIDKIRESVEDRQSRITWQTVNEVSRRKSTVKAKLKATSQLERIYQWKQHFDNLLGKPPKVTLCLTQTGPLSNTLHTRPIMLTIYTQLYVFKKFFLFNNNHLFAHSYNVSSN